MMLIFIHFFYTNGKNRKAVVRKYLLLICKCWKPIPCLRIRRACPTLDINIRRVSILFCRLFYYISEHMCKCRRDWGYVD